VVTKNERFIVVTVEEVPHSQILLRSIRAMWAAQFAKMKLIIHVLHLLSC